MKHRIRSTEVLRIACLWAVFSVPAQAIESLSDEDLAAIDAQDGVTLRMGGQTAATTISASRLSWNVDCNGTANCGGTYVANPQQASYNLNTVQFGPIGPNGAASATPYQFTALMDVGAAGVSGVPGVSLSTSWTRSRFKVGSVTMKPDATTSYGQLVLDSSGSLSVNNALWFFDTTCGASCFANVNLSTAGAQMYYRQSATAGQPELLFDNMNFSLSTSAAQLSLKPTGLFFSAASANVNWNFDLRYRASPASEFNTLTPADYTNFFYLGIESGFVNPSFQLKPGGMWLTGSPQYNESVRNQGLNLSFVTDLDPATFALVFGESATPTTPFTQVRFENWRSLKPGTSMLSIPNLTVDVVHGGGAGIPNIPTDFCIGADRAATSGFCSSNFKDRDPTPFATVSRFISSPAKGDEGDGIAILARDIQLLAYPTRVELVDPSVGGAPLVVDDPLDTKTFNWGVLFTTGNLDATVVAYPGSSGGAGTTGIRLDAVLTASTPQTAGNWDESLGTHFLLADTDANTAFGFLDMNWMLKADNAYIALLPGGVKISCSAAGATCFSAYVDGQFGGGDLFNLTDPTKVARGFDIIMRLNFSDFEVNFVPAINKLNYFGKMTLDSSATMVTQNYIMLTEPDYNVAAFTFGRLSGAADINNGEVNLKPSNDPSVTDGLQRLSFKQDFVITSPLKIDEISFSGQNLGRIVVPGGMIHSEIALKPQL